MSGSGHSIYEAMIPLAREALRGSEHPSTSRLIAYHCGEVPLPELMAIREHLSLCEECSTLILDAAKFFSDDAEEKAPSPDLEVEWRKLGAWTPRAQEYRSPASLPSMLPSNPRRSLIRSLAFAYGVAATFAGLSGGLILLRETSPFSRPQANTGVYFLTSSGSERSKLTKATPIRFQAPGQLALLILKPKSVLGSARYGIRIRSADGVVVWQFKDLVLQATGSFHLSLSAGTLPPGRYLLELYGITGGREKPLDTYLIAIK